MKHQPSEFVDDIKLAEASAWLSRLHGPRRFAEVESAFKAWLTEDPAHAKAYIRVADIWDIIPGAVRLDVDRAARTPWPRGRSRPRTWLAAAAACVLVAVAAGAAFFHSHEPVYQTTLGEVELVTLSDGTRVTLNTDTRLRVEYKEHGRYIRLERGEAIFEDVTDPQRPFIVQADGHQVRALGTTFQVRVAPASLSVTLLEGRVAVSRGTSADVQVKPTLLTPGERLVLRSDGRATIDHPSVDALTAWRRGEVVFDDVTLAHAIEEINRYGSTSVRLADPALGQLHVSGVFTVYDPAEFAQALAKLQHLHVVQSKGAITITR